MKPIYSLLLALIGLFVSNLALANKYDHYYLVCDVAGTEESLWIQPHELPRTMRLKVSFATLADESKPLGTRVSFGDPYKKPSVRFSNAFKVIPTGRNCDPKYDVSRFGMILRFGEMPKATVREILIAMGATNVPDFGEGTVMFGMPEFGHRNGPPADDSSYYYRHDRCEDMQDSTGETFMQMHMPAEKYDGLSYHFVFKSCSAYVTDPDNVKHPLTPERKRSKRTGD